MAKYYQMAQAGTPVTVRTSRPKFHSTATFVCPASAAVPAGAKGAAAAVTTEAGKRAAGAKAAVTEVGVLQGKLAKVLAVDPVKYTMRVGAGMRITEFLQEATKNKMSVQVSGWP